MCFCGTKTTPPGPLRGLANGSPLDHDQGQGELPPPPLDPTPAPPVPRVDQGQAGDFALPLDPHRGA